LDVVFTIVSRNYAAQAATLMDSLAIAEPNAQRVVVAADGPIPSLAGRAEVLDASTLPMPLDAMSLYYDALELNTAIKPTAFATLLNAPGVGSVTYLDPDIWVYRPLDAVREGLARAQLCLTPHLTRPLSGQANPNDRTILQSGSYNLGFMAARKDPEIFALLDWWKEKCRLDCRVDFAGGLFTDQRWMDLAPGFVTDFVRLRQPSLNLAYWNLEGRDLQQVDGAWRVDGEPLGFFHFSGFDPRRPDMLSKHQDRTWVREGSPLASLLADYAGKLLANGHATTAATPYAFDRFASGRAVTPAMRRRALRAAREGEGAPLGLTAAAEAWLDGAEPGAAIAGLPDITRLMDQVWRDAPAASGFDRASDEGRRAFHAWFDSAPGSDAQSKAAARALLGAEADARKPADPPWRESPWAGAASQVAVWLREPSADAAPRACAALLNARGDLRRRFAGDPKGLLAWCLGVEAAAGRFAPDLLPAEVLARADPALLAQAGRFAMPDGLATPLARRLFTAFTLAHRARWPQSLAAPLQAPFVGPATGYPAPFIALFLAIWTSRSDLQRLFPLTGARGRWRFLRWLAGGGLAEYGVDLAALPAAVRNHPSMRLATLSVRRRAEPPLDRAAGRCRTLVVVEDDAPLDLPASFTIYHARSGAFSDPAGHRRPAPRHAGLVCFLTQPGLVPVDAIALHARGVRWDEAAGLWSARTAATLTDGDGVAGFVDTVLTPDGVDRDPIRLRTSLLFPLIAP